MHPTTPYDHGTGSDDPVTRPDWASWAQEPTFNPPRNEARIVLVLLGVEAIARGLVFGLGFGVAGAGLGPDDVAVSENLVGAQALALLGALAVTGLTGVTWIIWLRTCYANLPALGVLGRYKMWWTVGAWFIPFVSLVMPKRLTDDILVSTSRGRPGGLVTVWWALFLIDQVAINGALVVGSIGWLVVLALVSVAGVATAAVLVVTVTEAQMLRRSERTGEVLSEPGRLLSFSGAQTGVVVVSTVALAAGIAVGPFRALAEQEAARGEPIQAMDLQTGDCFNLDDNREVDVVYRVSCDDPHNGQSLGHVMLDGSDYPGREDLVAFVSEACRERYELATGLPGTVEDLPIRLLSPLKAEWANGDRRVDCVLHVPHERRWTSQQGSPADRVMLRDLEDGECYVTDFDYVTYRPVDCARADFRVDAIKLYPLDAAAPYPGQDRIDRDIAGTCSTGVWIEPFPPLEEYWVFGDRVLLCADYDLPEDAGTVG